MTVHTVESALSAHGPEIYGWLLASLANPTEANDAYSLFGEDLWRSLPRYRGQCSIRTWCYMLARAAVVRVIELRGRRSAPLSEASESCLVAQPREPTLPHLCTDVKQGVRALRTQLEPDDQTLLVLRVDKNLSWHDIAIVMRGADASDADHARFAAALRKRFERVKARLRELAAELPALRARAS
jgi:RNA polymerase sigma-70 factor, ECF subfamily